MIRNHEGKFVSITLTMIADLEGFISDWKHWAIEAHRKGDNAEAMRCMAELRDCRDKLAALRA